ncbi:diacylglycerol/lipid kinase family protein [Pseudoflavonifractor phocaeensis]|uniref:diacylglycerol/lipid kinase family protein n=1 Tax=Pseudoflavonifractor phocaeensis TaxID=1870988 RepID=UPI0030B884B9
MSPIRHLFILNPSAGKNGQAAQALMEEIRRLPLDTAVRLTQKRGDAERIAREESAAGDPLRIYACGGDGTLNDVVNAAAGLDHVAVTNVPVGTGNDFLKLFGPQARQRFRDLTALSAGREVLFDVMDCNGRLGLDIVCAGVDARVAADVHRFKHIPMVRGIGAYILALLDNVLFRGINRPMRVETSEGLWYEGETAILCICNGRHYGGGFMPVPDAMPDDGVLDMLLVPKVGRLTFLRLVGAYGKGEYRRYPQYIQAYHGQSVTFSAQEELVAVVDGEVMRAHAFTLCLSPKKLRFFFPEGLDYAPNPGTPSL